MSHVHAGYEIALSWLADKNTTLTSTEVSRRLLRLPATSAATGPAG